jgi:adenylate cyclase
MSDVFISYKRENLAAVNRLAEALRSEGVGVWWDQDIAPNAPWEATIEKELKAARLVIVAWSPASVASDNVKAEARWARGQGRLLQVFVETCEPPLFFGERQGVDLKRWSGGVADPAFLTLLQAVRAGPMATPAASEPLLAPLPLPNKPSIAVMPFANLSGDPEQAYFADGMVEEIVGALSRFKSIFVIGSGSTFSFKNRSATPQEVGRQLGIRYVLEGSVRRSASRVRIAVKLTDASDGVQIWADRFEDTLEDVFALQDTVALSVAGVIEPTMLEAEIRRASKRPTENMGSYDLYLRARAAATAATAGMSDFLPALELLHRAISLDPGFGLALGEAANLHTILSLTVSSDRAADREKAIALIQQALQVAGDDAAVLVSVAGASMILGRDAEPVAAMIDRALALNPGSAEAWAASGRLRIALGEPELAAQHIETAMRLDPLSSSRALRLADLGCARLLQRRFDEAIALLRQSLELRPIFAPGHAWLAAALGHAGRLDEARAALAKFQVIGVGTVEAFAERRFKKPGNKALFLEGIDLALKRGPAANPS